MTQKRFSATQYALFSSMFGLPRVLAGPIAGFTVYAVGWETFFWLTLAAGIPGLALLARFVPPGTREPAFTVEPRRPGRPLTAGELTARGALGGLAGAAAGALAIAALGALKTLKDDPGRGFDLVAALAALARPEGLGGWLELGGLAAFGAVSGLLAAAVAAARHGAGRDLALAEDAEDAGAAPVAGR
jgi:PAT family beta-lactamase induction signal transducer AmpG